MLPHNGESIDLSTFIYKSVVNIICAVCFNISYEENDPKLTTIQTFTEGIVDALDHSSLVDIFPWLTVRRKPGLHFQIPLGQCPPVLSFP